MAAISRAGTAALRSEQVLGSRTRRTKKATPRKLPRTKGRLR